MSHKDAVSKKAVKGRFNSVTHHNLVHKPIPLPEAMKIHDAKAAVDKKWDTLKNLPACRESKSTK